MPHPYGAPEWLRESAVPLTSEEEGLLDALPLEPANQPPLISDQREHTRRLRQEPMLNLSARVAGRPPAKDAPLSAIPNEAAAYLDLRLLPGQDPYQIVDTLAARLAKTGPRSKLSVLGKLHPRRTSFEHPFVKQLKRAARRVWGADPPLEPLSTGTGSRHAIAKHADIPIVGTGIAYPGSGIARPNEHVRLDDSRNGIKFMAALLSEFGGAA